MAIVSLPISEDEITDRDKNRVKFGLCDLKPGMKNESIPRNDTDKST